MSKEFFAIADMHMHTRQPLGSDGRNTPEEMVDAAIQKVAGTGLTPALALTDHKVIGNVPEFLKHCRERGAIGVGGVELEFRAELYDIRDRRIDPHFREITITHGVSASLLRTAQLYPEVFFPFLQQLEDTNSNILIWVSDIHNLEENEFLARYSALHQKPESLAAYRSMKRDIDQKYDRLTPREDKEYPIRTDKAEVLCYFHPRIINSMNNTIDKLHTLYDEENRPTLHELMDFLGNEIGRNGRYFDQTRYILAHPVSIDATPWGKVLTMMVRKKTAKIRLATTELSDPDLLKLFHGAEVINAGHPVDINNLVRYLVHSPEIFGLYEALGPSNTGNSDSHDANWLFAAYTLMKIAHPSPKAVLDTLQNGEVIPRWGLNTINWPKIGNYTPFAFWSMLSPYTSEPNIDDKRFVAATKTILSGARRTLAPRVRDHIKVPTLEEAQKTWEIYEKRSE